MTEKGIHGNSVKKTRFPLYMSLVLAGTLILFYFAIPSFGNFCNEAWNVLTSNDETRIKQWVAGFGWFGPLVIILAMVAQMFLLIIPTILLMIVSILAYGPYWGSVLILVAIFIASTFGYFIGKYFGTLFIIKLLGKTTTKKITGFLNDYGFWAIIITRINPLLSNDAISFASGILKMNYWKFISATLLGIAPLIAFIAFTGKNTDSLKSGLLWGSAVSLVIFGIYIWWDKKQKKHKERNLH